MQLAHALENGAVVKLQSDAKSLRGGTIATSLEDLRDEGDVKNIPHRHLK
jgi:hypothetical protein